MKSPFKFLIVLFCLITIKMYAQNTFPSTGSVGIGTSSPSASSALEVKSTTQGVLLPRMTKTQRDAIVSPATGLLIYQTNNTPGLYYYDGGWSAVAPKSATKSLNNLTSPTAIPVDLLPNLNGTINLGSSILRWNNVYANSYQFSDATIQSTAFVPYIGGTGITIIGNQITNTGDTNPLDDASLDLSNLNATAINQSLISVTDNTLDIGSIDQQWHNLYLGNSIYSSGKRISFNSGTNSFYGNNTGSSNSIGIDNSFFGNEAGASNISGYNNSAFGNYSLHSNESGYKNTAVGDSSLASNIDGYVNTAIGDGALYSNTGGYKNTSIGAYSMYANITGKANTAVGGHSLHSNTLGDANVAIGVSSLEHNIVGNSNISIGKSAMVNLSNGSSNTGVGNHVLYSNTSLNYLTAVGDSALSFNNGGSGQNSALGASAGYGNTTGSNNTFIGYHAGITNVTGNQNTFLGSLCDATTANFSNVTSVGYGAIVNASNSMRFGNGSVTFWGFGANQTSGKALIVGSSTSNGNGAYCTSGGTWTNASSLNFKEDFIKLSKPEILEKIAKLNITKWKYIGTKNEYHIGPIAEEFYSAFEVGINNQSISTIDPSGIALIGIQALSDENKVLQEQVQNQENEINILRNDISEIKKMLDQIQESVSKCCIDCQKTDQISISQENIEIPYFEQNIPNPFSKYTQLNVYLPQSEGNAKVVITTLLGKLVMHFDLESSGMNQIIIDGSRFPSGIYYCSLLVNEKVIETKKMEITH